MIDVKMPQLGETVTEGTITRWMKSVGDKIQMDEPLFEVSTDKVDSEVPSPAAGVLAEVLVAQGDIVEVGVTVAVIDDGGGSAAPLEVGATKTSQSPEPAPASELTSVERSTNPDPLPSQHEVAGNEVVPRLVSPIVRKLLAENGIAEREVTGSGLGGRITRDDALRALDTRRVGLTGMESPSIVSPAEPTSGTVSGGGASADSSTPLAAKVSYQSRDQLAPFSNLRRRTAEHMVRSKATSPHAFIAKEVDFEAVERVRKAWGPRFKAEEGFALTYLPFVARATVEALREFPRLNSSVVDDSLLVHSEVNIGIAVDLSHEGLIVPVIPRVEELTLRGVARRIREMADRARTHQLKTDDISGGTITITNDGPFGTYFTVPIISQPQVAILATDGVSRRPVVVEQPDGSESIAIRSIGILGVSWDHRAVDGAYVSTFLARIAECLARRDWVAEL